jgi:ABC-type branched-subunit amino acid transport system ATPase component
MDFKINTISDIALEPVEWLAKPYLPRGKLVNLIGDPGVGKTSIALAIAAAISRGEKLPWDENPHSLSLDNPRIERTIVEKQAVLARLAIKLAFLHQIYCVLS